MPEPTPALVFEGRPIHTLTVRGRPAWSALELGAALSDPQLQARIVGPWADELVHGQDYALLAAAELAAAAAQVPHVLPLSKGVVVLFESGLHVVLARTFPRGRRLRRLMLERVLPFTRGDGDDLHLDAVMRELHAYLTLRQAAEVLADRDWMDAEVLAAEHGVPHCQILRALTALGLQQRPTHVWLRPVREGVGWRLTHRLSPDAVSLVEAWLAPQDPPAAA